VTRSRFGGPLVVVGSVALFVVLPLFAVGYVVIDLAGGDAGWAFREAFVVAADDVLHGDSPYPEEGDAQLARGTAYVYPPVLAQVLLVAAVFATLALLEVRDWRCYGLALLWPPVLSAVHVENITILMGLAAALVWRLRDRPAGGVTLGVSIAVKPLLWPLGFWLLALRSYLGLVYGAVVSVVLVLGSWALIGFAGILEYDDLLRLLSDAMDEWGYSVYALALDLGAGNTLAKALWLCVGVGLLAASFLVARRGDARRGFVLAVAAVIACSPIVWLHYFALLLVLVAVVQPTLGVAWLAPLLMYGSEEVTNGSTFQNALTLAAAALTVAVALYVAPSPQRRERGVQQPSPTSPLAEAP
jgi:Glycosyltransferase family 87